MLVFSLCGFDDDALDRHIAFCGNARVKVCERSAWQRGQPSFLAGFSASRGSRRRSRNAGPRTQRLQGRSSRQTGLVAGPKRFRLRSRGPTSQDEGHLSRRIPKRWSDTDRGITRLLSGVHLRGSVGDGRKRFSTWRSPFRDHGGRPDGGCSRRGEHPGLRFRDSRGSSIMAVPAVSYESQKKSGSRFALTFAIFWPGPPSARMIVA